MFLIRLSLFLSIIHKATAMRFWCIGHQQLYVLNNQLRKIRNNQIEMRFYLLFSEQIYVILRKQTNIKPQIC